MTDLFIQSYQGWLSAPQLAFESWLAEQAFRSSSACVYAAMWSKLLAYLDAEGLTLEHLEAAHIAAFLKANGLQRHHRQRYVRLIERVYHHLRTLRPTAGNPGSQAGQQRLGAGDNEPTAFFNRHERHVYPLIPRHLDKLLDDVYRSLAGYVRNAGGYEKTPTAFAEFVWADFFRRNIPLEDLKADFAAAVNTALPLALSELALGMPGYKGTRISTT